MTFDLVVRIEKLKTLTYKNWIAFLKGNNSSFAKDVYAEVAEIVNYELEALEAYTGKKLTLKDTTLDGGEGPTEDFFDDNYWMYGEGDTDWKDTFQEVSPKTIIISIKGSVTEAAVSGYESDKHIIEDIDFPQNKSDGKKSILPNGPGWYSYIDWENFAYILYLSDSTMDFDEKSYWAENFKNKPRKNVFGEYYASAEWVHLGDVDHITDTTTDIDAIIPWRDRNPKHIRYIPKKGCEVIITDGEVTYWSSDYVRQTGEVFFEEPGIMSDIELLKTF